MNAPQSFSGFAPGSEGYLDLQTRVRNATYLAGKFWGTANPGFRGTIRSRRIRGFTWACRPRSNRTPFAM